MYMNDAKNPRLTPRAQELRKNMTKQERHLWYDFLKSLHLGVKRQKVIGSYIVDFYIPSVKIVIELDGSQHYEAAGQSADAIRDAYLSSLGLRILRYSNSDVDRNFAAVCEDILNHLLPDESIDPKASPRGEAVGEAD